MNCVRVQDENIIERYLTGTLEPEAKEAWEEHYFACTECAHLLETWQSIEGALRADAPKIRSEMKPRSTAWIWAVAVAATVILGVGIDLSTRSAPVPQQSRPLDVVARLEPPTYIEPVTRGVESRADTLFREAMRHYTRQEWPQTIAGLRASLDLDGSLAAPRFFLGATYLLSGNAAEGVLELQRVSAGATPFTEEARFTLAEGYLMQGRKGEALSVLGQVAASQGDFAERAGTLMREIGGTK